MQLLVPLFLIFLLLGAANHSENVKLKQQVGVRIDGNTGQVDTFVNYTVNKKQDNAEIEIVFGN